MSIQIQGDTVIDSDKNVVGVNSITEKVVTDTITTSTYNVNLNLGNIFHLTIASNTTISFVNPASSGSTKAITLILERDGTSGRTVSFNNVRWTDGNLPELTTTANSIDVLNFFSINGGSWYFGSFSLADVK